jgi:hypothetical protein
MAPVAVAAGGGVLVATPVAVAEALVGVPVGGRAVPVGGTGDGSAVAVAEGELDAITTRAGAGPGEGVGVDGRGTAATPPGLPPTEAGKVSRNALLSRAASAATSGRKGAKPRLSPPNSP